MSPISTTERQVFAIILLLAGLLPIPAVALLLQAGWPNALQGIPFVEALALVEANRSAFRFGYGVLVLPHALPPAGGDPLVAHLTRVL